jgi:hypothetical protein
MTSELLFFAAAVLLIIGIGIYGAGLRKTSRESQSSGLPPGVVVRSTPVLTEAEVVLYNLLRLAVQDHYLIFAQVPLLSFVSVEFTGQARVQVLNQMALKRVDFVLVHPGSRQVEQVVQIDDGFTTASQTERQRVIQLAVEAAGIKLVTLQAQKSPGVADLVAILGLAGDE